MKRQLLLFFPLVTAMFAGAQMPADQQQAITLKRTIEKYHYAPRVADDSFSADVFDKVLTAIDAKGYLLTADEYDRLSAQRLRLDNELNGSDWQFLPQLTSVYARALKRADSLVELILAAPLDLNADDRVMLNSDRKRSFLKTIPELRSAWARRFKWELLNTVYDQWTEAGHKGTLRELIARNEAALRQKMKRQALTGLRQFDTPQDLAAHVRGEYLVALSTSYDRHTQYFSPVEMEKFKSELSTQERIYGFLLDDKEGKVIISNLIPGGSAWKSGAVHANDQVLQVGFPGKDPQDATLLTADEVDELIDNSPSEQLTLKLRRGDGSISTVELRKDKVEVEENSVKGYVLKGSRRIGYISLPDFYTSWNDAGGSGCANDVAREIVNLKKEGIEGLVLDLRSNGGGSMQEALQLAGIFIDEGPLFGVREKDGKAAFLKDPNRGTSWDGPLTVLINGQSASASEILAGTLQDYHRAVITGSGSYGKATMQQIFPVDTMNRENKKPEFGFVKVTVGKLFRLDGTTAQLQGIRPDIPLPDAYDVLDYRERNLPNVLPADTERRNNYYKPLPLLPAAPLLQSSKQRIASHPGFVELSAKLARFAAFYRNKNQQVPLRVEAFEKWRSAASSGDPEEEAETPETKPTTVFEVMNHQREQQRIGNNDYARTLNERIVRQLRSDLYVEEAYRILCDLIQQNPTKQ